VEIRANGRERLLRVVAGLVIRSLLAQVWVAGAMKLKVAPGGRARGACRHMTRRPTPLPVGLQVLDQFPFEDLPARAERQRRDELDASGKGGHRSDPGRSRHRRREESREEHQPASSFRKGEAVAQQRGSGSELYEFQSH
jgi:hypothetical protein